ncbi:MAG: hypothetical protein ACQEXG_01790 [Pseudomonadota bacterium]
MTSDAIANLVNDIFQPREDYYGVSEWSNHIGEILVILERIQENSDAQYHCWDVEDLEKVKAEFSNTSLANNWRDKAIKTPKMGKKGIKSESPITCAIVSADKRNSKKLHMIIVSHIIHAAKWWREEIKKEENERDTGSNFNINRYNSRYYPNLENACRAVRRISNDTLAIIPCETYNIEAFYSKLEETLENIKLDNTITDTEKNYISGIERLLAFGYRKRMLIEGPLIRNRYRINDFEVQLIHEAIYFDQGQPPCWVEKEIDLGTDDEESRKIIVSNHKNSGLAISEELSPIELVGKKEKIDGKKGDSPIQSMYRSKYKSKHITKNAQLVPHRWSALSQIEVRHLFQHLSESKDAISGSRTALAISLITGKPFEHVIKARIVNKLTHVPRKIDHDDIFIVLENCCWVSGVLELEDRRQSKSQWHGIFESVKGHIRTVIPIHFWMLIAPYLATAAQRSTTKSAALFNNTHSEKLEVSCQETLSELNKKHRILLTLHRIKDIVFNFIIKKGGDIADACLITGSHPPTGHISSLYYYAPTEKHLNNIYSQAVVKILGQNPGICLEKFERIEIKFHAERVGSPITPRPAYVSEAVSEMLGRFTSPTEKQYHPDHFIEMHNTITIYTIMMMNFSTGYRSIKDPLSEFEQLNLRRKSMVIADKVNNSMHNARVVPITDIFIRQLHQYRLHCDFVKHRLRLFFNYETSRPFFLLNNNLEPKPVTPDRLQRHLALKDNPPLNVNRHYLRTRLRELHVPGEHVDIFMGHWGIDQNPFGRHSTFNIKNYLTSVRNALNIILLDNNWKVMEGLA